MSFIRPEVSAGLMKWREVLSGAAILIVAVLLMRNGLGARFWFGGLIGALGLGLVVSGIPRARARLGGGGAGVVDIDERRITYFGPVQGGAMALDDLSRIAAGPGRNWVLTSVEGDTLTIPMTAEGADQLFDAFAALPGISQSRLVQATGGAVDTRRVIWEKPHPRLG
ncbi:hypothetical protein GQ651_15750 [Alphaproteobacteria bacterium GH1-50]|uniref:Uncharacterized protein n=1 Tax=Kangsaoukella pontilimi TaxID=2691042 RepID=A0A7C9NG89_9RHOB|nr:hypothetical protein [Kangsaoukella pontilimi]MXQ09299.1 hypothetical protein [Kangsaoukella pontilimi]